MWSERLEKIDFRVMEMRIFMIIRLFSVAFTAVFLLVMLTPLPYLLSGPLAVEHGKHGRSDAAIVLGGGASQGALTTASRDRFLNGVLLYREGAVKNIIFSGGSINSPVDKLLRTFFKKNVAADSLDAELMLQMSKRLGVAAKDAFAERSSTNTYENLAMSAEIMERENFRTCLIVTSPMHMKRAMLVSKKLGLDCSPAPLEDYTVRRRGAIDRLSLVREALWEYAALTIYRYYGYI